MKIGTRRILWFFGAAVAVFCIAAASGVFSFNVTLSASRIQEMVDKKLPLQGHKGPLKWEVRAAELHFEEAGIVRIHALVHGGFLSEQTDAILEGSAKPVFHDGAFRVHDISITNLSIVPRNTVEEVSPNLAAGNAHGTRELLRTRLRNSARDFLSGGTVQDRLDGIKSTATEALKADASVILENVMDSVALYRPSASSDIRVRMLPVILTGFTVTEDTVTAHLDPAGGIVRYVLMIVAVIICIAVIVINLMLS